MVVTQPPETNVVVLFWGLNCKQPKSPPLLKTTCQCARPKIRGLEPNILQYSLLKSQIDHKVIDYHAVHLK